MKQFALAAAFSMSLFHGGAPSFASDAPVPTSFSYTVPAGGFSRTIRIMHVASGTPRLAHMGLHKGGEVIRLELAAWPGDRVQIMINGILKEELPVELALQAPEPPATPAVSSTPIFAPATASISSSLPLASTSETISVVSAVEPPPVPLVASPTQTIAPGKPQRIVSGSGVRLRATPSVSAAEVGKLALGTLVDELEIGAKEEKIGSRSGRWYRVALPDGRDGWIFGAFTIPVSGTDRDAAFMTLANARLDLEKQTPNELLELHQLLRGAIGQASSEASRAGLEFWALLALNRYLRESGRSSVPDAVPAAVSAYADELVYSEP
ncbi:MAG TPA: SH3 domain-containing protein, partial [Candidatus Ozemobacteraceae bacterium]|nr:SH3 domain-containing protein [Candidatus Ozemobacteraceae bacterium]